MEALGEPIMSSTLLLDEPVPLNDPREMRRVLGKRVDLIIDGGSSGVQPTTVIDQTGGISRVLRFGRGDAAMIV